MGFDHLRRFASILLVPAAAAAFALPCFAQSLDADGSARRDAAIAAARGGDYPTALAALEALRTEYPDDRSLLNDQVTVLAWSEDDLGAVVFSASLDPAGTPRYVQLAVAKAARNIRQFDVAANWYDAAIAADSRDRDALAGRLLTAADAGDRATALALIDQVAKPELRDVDLDLARAYALDALGDRLAALAVYDSILELHPAQADALRGKALELRALLLPAQALELAAQHPGILTEAETERLRADEAAIRTRLTSRTPYPEPDVYTAADLSLEFLNAQLAATTTAAARDSLLLDRVVALSDQNLADQAIAAFEDLPPTANRDQAYVLAAAARAYLQARRPETAERLLRRAHEIDPHNLDVRFTLVYALLDLNRTDEARALVTDIMASQPMVLREPGSNVVKGNETRIRAEVLAGIADADANQLESAQARFEQLLSEAPNNSELRQELAQVYQWRGWLDRSLDSFRQVLTNSNDLLSARVGYANAQIEAREYREVDTSLADMTSVYGREPMVQQLADRWQIHNQRELYLSASSGDSSGPVSGANNYSIDARWYTAPVAYRYRVFVSAHDGYAEFPEGEAERRRLGTGIEYRLPRFTATAQLSGARSGGSLGFAATAEFRRNDFWTINGGFELDSDATQLRAYRLGIESDRGFVGASFAPSELASVDFGLDHAEYTDGNALDTVYVDGRYRFLSGPRSGLDVTASLGMSSADTSDVPYFSPTGASTLMLGLSHELRLRRRYDKALTQKLSVATGRYAQDGFATGSIWSAGYGIEWSFSERHWLSLEAQRQGQFFDGGREYSNVAVLTLRSRF